MSLPSGRVHRMNELDRKIEREIGAFARFSSTSEGVTRLPFSRENDLAIEYLKDRLYSIGKRVYVDAYGNVASASSDLISAKDKTYLISHYDSVPKGGRFDGIAGIVLGLLLIEALEEPAKGRTELLAFNIEESSMFGRASIGSKTFFEDENSVPDYLPLLRGGKSLRSSLLAKQYQKYTEIGKPVIGKNSRFLEVHVDQSRELWDHRSEIGIVGVIAGQKRLSLQFTGRTGHSSLMDLSSRKDALFCASYVIAKVGELSRVYNPSGVIGTVTQIKNEPNVTNMIPGNVELFLDVRGIEKGSLERFREEVVDFSANHARKSGLAFSWNTVSEYDPALLDQAYADVLEKRMLQAKITPKRMHSMAWHDSAEVNKYYKTNLLLVSNKTGESHSPLEQMNIDSFRELLIFLISFIGGSHDSTESCSDG